MWSQEDARPGTRPAQPADAAGNRKPGDLSEVRTAQLGRSVFIKGDITGSEDLTVDGQVEGRIDLPNHVLTVGPNATICADITAKGVMIFGTVLGSIKAHERVEVRKSGSVEGNVSCASFVVQDGAILSGKIETRGERRRPQARTPATENSAQVLAPVA
jgi:cytoskeletal protein CcmA (bactofilin family)